MARSSGTQFPSGAVAGSSPIREWLGAAVLFLAVVIAYQPVWYAGFIWDDDTYVTANPVVTGPLDLRAIWLSQAANICPLTITTFWLEHKLWGLDPLGYHLVNVLLHAGGAIVLWRLLRRLEIPGAWLGAALWALHPVLVESVAWISELKNTQSTFFYLLSLLFFARWLKGEGRARWNYALTLLFAAMAMASKTSTMILPLVFVLCAGWVDRRWHWRRSLAVAPAFLLALAAGLLSIWTQAVPDAAWTPRSWPERLITAGDAIWFYLGKLIVPYPLLTNYPRWKIDTGNALEYLPLLAAVTLLVVFWLKRATWGRPWFFTFAYFVVALAPVLGLVEHGFERYLRYSSVADHFQNLACMAPLALAGAGLANFSNRIGSSWPSWHRFTPAAALVFIVGLLTWQKAWTYQDQETLWTYTLRWNPDAWAARGNLGSVYYQRGEIDRAIAEFQAALVLNPGYADIHYDLGLALAQKGEFNAAIGHYRLALEGRPDDEGCHYNLAAALAQKGDDAGAIGEFQKALALNSNDLEARFHLALAFVRSHRIDDAVTQFRFIAHARPGDAAAHNNLAGALLQAGHIGESIAELQTALQLQPDFPEAQKNLAKARAIQGQPSIK